jgi:hypothetical protein
MEHGDVILLRDIRDAEYPIRRGPGALASREHPFRAEGLLEIGCTDDLAGLVQQRLGVFRRKRQGEGAEESDGEREEGFHAMG